MHAACQNGGSAGSGGLIRACTIPAGSRSRCTLGRTVRLRWMPRRCRGGGTASARREPRRAGGVVAARAYIPVRTRYRGHPWPLPRYPWPATSSGVPVPSLRSRVASCKRTNAVKAPRSTGVPAVGFPRRFPRLEGPPYCLPTGSKGGGARRRRAPGDMEVRRRQCGGPWSDRSAFSGVPEVRTTKLPPAATRGTPAPRATACGRRGRRSRAGATVAPRPPAAPAPARRPSSAAARSRPGRRRPSS